MKNTRFALLSSVVLLCASCGGGKGGNGGNEIDLSKFPNYIADYENLSYEFGDKQLSDPYWKGNVIYNETVLLTKNAETGVISGKLSHKPLKIIAVKDYTLKTTDYVEGTDYTIEGNVMTRTENSSMPYLNEKVLEGQDLPDGYNLTSSITNILTDCVQMGPAYYTESPLYYGNQVSVSYVYDVKEIYSNLDQYPTYNMDKLPKVKAKLEAGEPLKIVALGDSVLEGCSSSKKFNHEPFMDNFMELTRQNLARLYGSEVTLTNLSVGGKQSAWGCERVNAVVEENPDLFFLHFGINDLGANVSPGIYLDNMQAIVLNLKAALPDVEIIIMTPFAPNSNLYDYDGIRKYNKYIKEDIVDVTDGVELIDVSTLSFLEYQNKKYQDMTANGINHINDYGSRLYLQAILATLYKY